MNKQTFGYIAILLALLISIAVVERAHARTAICWLCDFDPTQPAVQEEGHIWWVGDCIPVSQGGYTDCSVDFIQDAERCRNHGSFCTF